MSDGGSPRGARFSGFDWEGADDLTALSGEELARGLEELAEEERAVGYRQRVLRGRIDLVRAELSRRDGFALSSEELADVLMGRLLEGRPGGFR